MQLTTRIVDKVCNLAVAAENVCRTTNNFIGALLELCRTAAIRLYYYETVVLEVFRLVVRLRETRELNCRRNPSCGVWRCALVVLRTLQIESALELRARNRLNNCVKKVRWTFVERSNLKLISFLDCLFELFRRFVQSVT